MTMSSWTEKPHVVPTINVNLKPCECTGIADNYCTCGAKPVLLPCSLPGSVTFQVVLGECADAHRLQHDPTLTPGCGADHHAHSCPARPVKVFCSISGKTWEESTVTDVDGPFFGLALEACRARWALVKAMVVGTSRRFFEGWAPNPWPQIDAMLAQRDAVYSALADMARAEDGQCDARDRIYKAMGLPPSKRLASDLRESVIELGVYIDRLIESVSVLP